jgi:hypothetical protein
MGMGRMEISVIARQALLYGHIIAFALALATILKEDVHLLRAQRIDSASLLAAATLVKWLLLALWVTGVPLVMMEIGTDVSLLLDKPKLLAKLIVVGALTLNGILLHLVAFPMVTGKPQNPNKAATILATLGAVSVTSWLYASFVAISRIAALSLHNFVILYLLALALAVSVAILVVRKRLELLLKSSDDLTEISDGQGHSLSVALLEVELKRLARSDIGRSGNDALGFDQSSRTFSCVTHSRGTRYSSRYGSHRSSEALIKDSRSRCQKAISCRAAI